MFFTSHLNARKRAKEQHMAGLATEDVMAIIEGSSKNEEKLFVEFDTYPVKNDEKSLEFGYEFFDDAEYLRIIVPGDPGNTVHRAVTYCKSRQRCTFDTSRGPPCDVHRFPRQYAAFKGGLDQQDASGLPLSMWPMATKALVATLKAQRVHTVEQLAAIPDANLPNMGPLRSIRQQAQDFLETARGNAPTQKLRKQLEAQQNELETQKRIIEEQGKKLDELMKAQQTLPPAPAANEQRPRR